ncbi:MAG: serine hydrolase [Candidatus Palauibacterales bacterium]|nr:serine hydrolase [Candidatus Palauibacterales bacterium]MDP2528569.1 serine hydrolase [Candidatus Palauibacterales bacterium]MDP2584799.1 serine hydrolase [Candidatus Palauibacterales bacterium]
MSSRPRPTAAASRVSLIAVVSATLLACGPPAGAPEAGAGPWLQYAEPAEAGFDGDRLDRACDYADSVGSAAVMAVFRGHAVVACGAVDRNLELHSVRKSLVSALYGTAVAAGSIDLEASLADLGIDDGGKLTAAEGRATVRDLLTARSGVYLPAAYAPQSQDEERPERGSHSPGTFWFYNNWDFNVAGVIFERETGEDLYRAFERRIARPIGMEDWSPSDGFRAYEPTRSTYPAQTFRMSARDLARFGQLYLQEGRWDGRQVIPADWVRTSTTPVSDLGHGSGYAYLWWTYAPGALSADRYPTLSGQRIYMGRGTGSQAVWVIPGLDLVIVHRADTDHGREIHGVDAWRIAELISEARGGEPSSDPRLVALDPRPFASQLPAYRWPEPVTLDSAALQPFMGDYDLSSGGTVRVFRFRGDPYIHVPGRGDALLLPLGGDRFTVRVVAGVQVVFQRDATGAVTGVTLTLGNQTMRAARHPEATGTAPGG